MLKYLRSLQPYTGTMRLNEAQQEALKQVMAGGGMGGLLRTSYDIKAGEAGRRDIAATLSQAQGLIGQNLNMNYKQNIPKAPQQTATQTQQQPQQPQQQAQQQAQQQTGAPAKTTETAQPAQQKEDSTAKHTSQMTTAIMENAMTSMTTAFENMNEATMITAQNSQRNMENNPILKQLQP